MWRTASDAAMALTVRTQSRGAASNLVAKLEDQEPQRVAIPGVQRLAAVLPSTRRSTTRDGDATMAACEDQQHSGCEISGRTPSSQRFSKRELSGAVMPGQAPELAVDDRRRHREGDQRYDAKTIEPGPVPLA